MTPASEEQESRPSPVDSSPENTHSKHLRRLHCSGAGLPTAWYRVSGDFAAHGASLREGRDRAGMISHFLLTVCLSRECTRPVAKT